MVVEDITPEVEYTANGSTTDFSFTFSYTRPSDVEVYKDNVKQVNDDTVYTLDNFSSSDSGIIKFLTAPTADTLIRVKRNTSLSQEYNFAGRLIELQAEKGLDKVTQITQENKLDVTKGLRLPLSEVNTIDANLPTLSAGQTYKRNSANTAFEAHSLLAESDITSSVTAAQAAQTAAEAAQTAAEAALSTSMQTDEAETVTSQHTFSTCPLITGTISQDNHAVTKSYVDNQILINTNNTLIEMGQTAAKTQDFDVLDSGPSTTLIASMSFDPLGVDGDYRFWYGGGLGKLSGATNFSVYMTYYTITNGVNTSETTVRSTIRTFSNTSIVISNNVFNIGRIITIPGTVDTVVLRMYVSTEGGSGSEDFRVDTLVLGYDKYKTGLVVRDFPIG